MTIPTPAHVLSFPRPDPPAEPLGPLLCPLCHTAAPLTQAAMDAGGIFRCARCKQQWDSARLNAVARYAARVTADGAAR